MSGALFAAALLVAGQTSAQDLHVVQGVWTSAVQQKQYTNQLRSGAAVGELHFWTLLKGGRKTLEELQSRGKLPIVHEWKYSSPLRIAADPMSPVQENEQEVAKLLGVGAIVDSGGIKATVDEGREFRWRTWSHKQSLWRGKWVVRVLYANGEPVPCEIGPCEWTFTVR